MASSETAQKKRPRAALVLAAHGERNVNSPNIILAGHAQALDQRFPDMPVTFGVLNGEPSFVEAVTGAITKGADRIYVYPFFMSDGYFVASALPEKIATSKFSVPIEIMAPLGLEAALPRIMMKASLKAAQQAGFNPECTRLLIVGHGSKSDSSSLEATAKMAASLKCMAGFKDISIALLEEAPFIKEQLECDASPVVVAGFFAGDGMHGAHDVPEALMHSDVPSVYAGPVGGCSEICDVIAGALLQNLMIAEGDQT